MTGTWRKGSTVVRVDADGTVWVSESGCAEAIWQAATVALRGSWYPAAWFGRFGWERLQ